MMTQQPSTSLPNDSDRLQIGQVVGFHGVKGAVKVKTENENPQWLKTLDVVYLKAGANWQTLTIMDGFQKSPSVVVLRFKEIKDRNQAEKDLNQQFVYALKTDLPELEDGEFLIDDLLGLTVIEQVSGITETTGKTVGVVKNLVFGGGQDFLDIELAGSGKILTVPFNQHFFPQVDLITKTITGYQLSQFIDDSSET